MRLFGGKDYYDSALMYGRDETVKFIRQKEKVLPLNELPHEPISFSYLYGLGRSDIKPLQVYFCGKLYFGVSVPVKDPIHFSVTHIAWTYEHYQQLRVLERPSSFDRYCYDRKQNSSLDKQVKELFAKSGSDKYRDILAAKNITIAVLDNTSYHDSDAHWLIDGFKLKDIEFFKVKDTYAAYTEIYDWVSGVLPNQGRPAPDITDDLVKIAKHGFDVKTSFRKEKTKR